MALSRITQTQILARVTLNGTDGTAANAGDFIVQSTSADENDNILLEENTDFGTDILSSPQINGYFFGGGTPSLMSPSEMRNLFDIIRNFKSQKNSKFFFSFCIIL